MFFWAIIYHLGHSSVSTPFLDPVLKLNIKGVAKVVAETAWFGNMLLDYTLLFRLPHLSTTTTLVPFTCLPTMFNTNRQNILRVTFFLSVTWLLLVRCEFSMYHFGTSTLIYHEGITFRFVWRILIQFKRPAPPSPTALAYFSM